VLMFHLQSVTFTEHFFDYVGVGTQAFVLARQALYCSSHTSSPLCSVNLEIGSCFLPRPAWTRSPILCSYWLRRCLVNFLPGWPGTAVLLISGSQVAKITGVSQKYWLSAFQYSEQVCYHSFENEASHQNPNGMKPL
jgi:hypothetical protein